MECEKDPHRRRHAKSEKQRSHAVCKQKHHQQEKDSRLSHGCTSLMYACQQGLTGSIVEELRNKPESVHKRDRSNKSALHYCSGQKDLVAAASVAMAAPELLESADEDGFTPLHLAVIQGNLSLVNLLLANKADVNSLDSEGHSVVHWATVCGEIEALRAVLAAGADVSTPDINGGSPLHYAAQMCGASYEGKPGQTSSKLALEILNILLRHPKSSVEVVDKDGRQPLLWAASAGSAKAVLALVKAGARVESSDKDGLTALHCAASRGHTQCIDTIISLCGAPTDLIDSNGCTALHYAVTLGHADATSLLLDLEADPNRQDRKGRTPAHCGCAKGQFETVKILGARNANLWLRNAKGDLPVHEAASSGRRELVQWLLEQRPKQVNTTSNDGRTLLHIAASNDNSEMCKMLLDYGADVNSIHRTSRNVVMTPLDCALQGGFRSTAKFIQIHGGLPASKLRLSGRNPNALNDQELVKPLKFAEMEKILDLSSETVNQVNQENQKRYVVYVKRSASEGSVSHSEAENMYSRAKNKAHSHRDSPCSHHKHRHKRRTSSCSDTFLVGKDDRDGSMCRSKSNIEIRRRKKSKGKYSSSSEEESSSSSDSDCCKHKKKKSKHKYCKKYSVSVKHKSQHKYDSDDAGRGRCKKRKTKGKRRDDSESEQTTDVSEPERSPCHKKSEKSKSKKDIRMEDKKTQSYEVTPEGEVQKDGMKKIEQDMMESEKRKALSEFETVDKIQQPESEQGKYEKEIDQQRQGLQQVLLEESMKAQKQEEKPISSIPSSSRPGSAKKRPQSARISSAQRRQQKQAEQKAKLSATAEVAEDGIGPPEKAIEPEKMASLAQPVDKPIQDFSDEGDEIAKKVTTQAEVHAATPIEKDQLTVKEDDKHGDEEDALSDITFTIDKHGKGEDIEEKHRINDFEDIEETVHDTEYPGEKQIATDAGVDRTGDDESKILSRKEEQLNEPLLQSEEEKLQQLGHEQIKESVDEAGQKTQLETEPLSFGQLQQPSTTEKRDTKLKSSTKRSKTPVSQTQPDQTLVDKSFAVVCDKPHEQVEDEDQGTESSFTVLEAEIMPSSSSRTPSPEKRRPPSFQVLGDASSRRGVQYSSDDDRSKRIDKTAMSQGYAEGETDMKGRTISADKNGRRKRLKKRLKSTKDSDDKSDDDLLTRAQQQSKDQDSGFEPSPRAMKTKIPSPRTTHTAVMPRRSAFTMLENRSMSSRPEGRKPGDQNAVNMATVTQSIQKNIRRYYMERKIFQHLLELKSLQIRSSKTNEAILVKRAVDDYHKSVQALGYETGGTLRRFPYKEYTFKNFEIFLYETLKSLQKSGTCNFQNISDVYKEAERRLSPDYSRYEKALQCTTKTHRCLHAAHAYTGIPCAAYIPMMNHHTIPKLGFGPYKTTGVGSFYLPKILTGTPTCGNKVSLELSHGSSKQLIPLPSEKLDSNKRYYVTFTVKGNENATLTTTPTNCENAQQQQQQQEDQKCNRDETTTE